jgi:hypothetical protein
MSGLYGLPFGLGDIGAIPLQTFQPGNREDSMDLKKGKLNSAFHHVSRVEIEFLRTKFDSQKKTRLGELVLRLALAYEELKVKAGK